MGAALKKNGRVVLAWLGLALLSGIVAWQLYGFMISAGWVLTQSETMNRYGWNSYTIGLISKFGVLAAGIFWIFSLSLFENLLRRWEKEDQLKDKTVRTAGIFILSAVLLFGFSYLINI